MGIRMQPVVVVASVLLSSSFPWETFVDAANENADVEIHNPLTAFKQCSHGDKEWHICHAYYQPEWYCPTVLEFNSSHVEDIAPCFTCPDAESDCEKVVRDFLIVNNISEEATYDDDWGFNIGDELISSCQVLCEAGKKGDACSSGYFDHYGYYQGDSCTPGFHFCDFASDEDFAMNISGTCKACPSDPDECYQDGFVTSFEGKRNCAGCTLSCYEQGTSSLTVNGKEISSLPIIYAIQKSYQNASGPLIDCSNLLLEREDVCAGAEGHVCIVDYSVMGESKVRKFGWELSNAAEKNGCVAIIMIGRAGIKDLDELAIPFIEIGEEDRKHMLKNEPHAVAQVEVQLFGSRCYSDFLDCNIKLPCDENEYCYFSRLVVNEEYTEGVCTACPTFDGRPDPAGCFFDRNGYEDNTFSWISPEVVKSCAKECNATLVSDGCKFCLSEVSAFDFGVEDKADQCYFCPNDDVQNHDKIVPLFGKNITCWMIQTFFKRMEVHKDSPNCRLVQSMNYMCGCDGTGYAGANTHMKQVVLVWFPRVAAILSIAGSLFIIYDTLRTRQKRAKLMNRLLSTLSLFDIMGSIAYALTTLPTPESDELYGAKGNERTCKAQGFFIQIGTIACFLNVSLAHYYLLTIKYGWTEERLKGKRVVYFLFIPPVVVGLVYAFVGIRHYDNVRVWCNNSAKWWPEIPVILAIIAATAIMGTLCLHVYKIEKQTAQYTNVRTRLSTKVFKQSCWFVVAFYITWLPYLTLQYMLSSGMGYNSYGLILSASTLVPLQGFWNNFVYIRPRYLSKFISHVGSSIRRVSSFFQRKSKGDATEQSVLNSLQQSGLHDQLQVVQASENSFICSKDDEYNYAKTPNKKGIDGKSFETTQRDNLDPKSDDNNDGRGLTGFPNLCDSNSNVAMENVAVEEPLRVLKSNNSELDQGVLCYTDGKEVIPVGAVFDSALQRRGPAADNCGSIQEGECNDDQLFLINIIGEYA